MSDPRNDAALLAYVSVAQSSAMAVQDAVALMRHVDIISAAAMAAINEKIIETTPTGDEKPWIAALAAVTQNLKEVADYFDTVGKAAASVLSYFDPGVTTPPTPEP